MCQHLRRPVLRELLNPRRIALIGASSDATRLTARAQRYLRRHGFSGEVFPVNPKADTVLGERAYPSLAAIDGGEKIDLAYILVGTTQVEAAMRDVADSGIPVAIILADGFGEAGAEGLARQHRVLDIARAGGVRVLGPNSMGVINVPAGTAACVNAALECDNLVPGRISLVSHSGSVMGALLSRAAARGFGFAKLIGSGNEADLSAGEIADALVDDPDTDAILLFLETVRAPDALANAARRAAAAKKPIIAYLLGRSAAGAALAVTHTGAIAGSDAAADSFLRDIGIVRVDMMETLLEIAPLLIGRDPPQNPRRAVRVVTTTGGGGAMVVDRLGMLGIATARMQDMTLAGTAPDKVAAALTEARGAPESDLAIAVIGSSAQFRPQDAVAGVIAATGPAPLAVFLAPQADASLAVLARAGVAAFRTPEACADAVRAYLAWRAPRARPDPGDVSAAAALLPGVVDEAGARAVFAALGLPDGAQRIDPDAPPALAYPVALKAIVPGLAHKTEAGAVRLNIADAASLAAAAAAMRARLGDAIAGFLAQPMARGVAEVLIGYRRDLAIGPVVVVGTGGVWAELFADAVTHPAPVTLDEAREMIASVRGLTPLRGYRGQPPGDIAALAHAIVCVSRLAGLPDVAEAEINPLIVLAEGRGVAVADALLLTSMATEPRV